MRIVLDTNVYVRDFRMSGADFQMLLSTFAVTGHKLFVPEIILDEVCQKFREKLKLARIELDKAHASVVRLVPHYRPIVGRSLDDAAEDYKREFRETLVTAAGARVMPYPRTSHASFGRRAVEKRHPFDDEGAGYRDALIWDAVLALARQRGDDVAFVTQDIGDFLVKVDEGVALHPDLVADVAAVSRKGHRVRPYHTLGRFVGEEIQPRLKELGNVRGAIQEHGTLGKIEVRSALLQELKALLEHSYIAASWLGFPDGTDAMIDEVLAVPSITVRDVRRLSDARLVLTVTASVEVRFFIAYPEVPPPETSSVEDHLDTSSLPHEWDNTEEGAFTANLRVLVNKSRSKISSVQLRSFDPAA